MVESYFASTVFQFASPTGNIRLNGRVSFHQDGGWRVEFDGPLGVKLAVLETRDDRFRLKLPQAGQTIDGNLEEGLTIPDLEVNLPAVGDLTPLLLPTVDLNSLEDWRVSQAKVGNSGLLTLIKQGRTGTDSLVLSLDYSPVRVLSEEHWRKDHRLFKRELHYKTNPNYLPDKIVVKTDELMLCIKYKSMRLNLR